MRQEPYRAFRGLGTTWMQLEDPRRSILAGFHGPEVTPNRSAELAIRGDDPQGAIGSRDAETEPTASALIERKKPIARCS
jgi:hypothetical protein